MKRFIITALALSIALVSCEKDVLRGQGRIIKEDRTYLVGAGFNAITINGSTDVYIIQGNQYKLEVEGYENLLRSFAVEVRNSTLTNEFRNYYNIKNDNTVIYITMRIIPDVYVNGSAKAEIQGNYPYREHVSIRVNGSGRVFYGAGSSKYIDVNISGSGKISAVSFVSQDANVAISGSGEVKLNSTSKLDANISGSGTVYYIGNPIITSNISGSGKVMRLN